MDPDQTAPLGSGIIVFALIIKLVWSVLEYMQQT